jgi:hypothetical protein
MKKSEAPPLPDLQSLHETTGLDKFFLHPTRGCMVVAPTADRWIFYDLVNKQPVRYSEWVDGKEKVMSFDPEN